MASGDSPLAISPSHSPFARSLAREALAGAGFRERLADFEAEVVHRRLLTHAEVLTLRLTLGLLGRAGDVDGDFRLDFRMQVDRHGVEAERLDRMLNEDMAALDGEARGGQRLRDVARRHRPIELSGLAGLANDDHRRPVYLGGNLVGAALELVVARFEFGALGLEFLLVGLGRAQRLAARQQEVAGVAVLDADGVAHGTELADALQQYDVHRCL